MFFYAKIIPIQIGGYFTSKYMFDDIKNIYSYYKDLGDSKKCIIFKIQPVVWPLEAILGQKNDFFRLFSCEGATWNWILCIFKSI